MVQLSNVFYNTALWYDILDKYGVKSYNQLFTCPIYTLPTLYSTVWNGVSKSYRYLPFSLAELQTTLYGVRRWNSDNLDTKLFLLMCLEVIFVRVCRLELVIYEIIHLYVFAQSYNNFDVSSENQKSIYRSLLNFYIIHIAFIQSRWKSQPYYFLKIGLLWNGCFLNIFVYFYFYFRYFVLSTLG
jgi:hypothetical protein